MQRTKKQQQQYITCKNYRRFLKDQGRHNKRRDKYKRKSSFAKPTMPYRDRITKKVDKSDIKKLPPILDFLLANKNVFSSNPVIIPRDGILRVPEIFSLSDAPEETSQFLKSFLYSLQFPTQETIIIDYSKCKRIDLGASITMDIIFTEFIEHFKNLQKYNLPLPIISISGQNLHDENVKRFIYSIGTHRTITGIKLNYPDIATYALRIGKKGSNPGSIEIESTKLVEHIEKCLSMMKMTLNQTAQENLADIIGEVLNNAEIHSSTDYRYSIGHFEKSKEGDKNVGVFQFVIFNFGQTIYERLKDKEACLNQAAVVEMQHLSEEYTKKGWLGLGKDKTMEESLWTLYALQDGVSCLSPHRGNGTMNFIESFLSIKGNEKSDESKLILFSGNTKIICDGTYHTFEKVNHLGEKHKLITFNDEKSIEEKPNEKFVTFVKNYFPGTMIYAKVYIKPENLEQ